MKKLFTLALLCLGFVALSCEEEIQDTEKAVTSLKVMNGDTIDVYVGDTAYIDVKYFPSDVLAPRLYWYGYNQLLLKANDKEGFIVGRKRGSTILNIGTRDSDISTSCFINILPVSFNLSYTEKAIYVADTFSIKPILPDDAARKVRWQSSKPSVAAVDFNGVVKGLSAGECVISAVAYVNSDTICSNTCHITVSNMDMESLTLSDTLREVALKSSFNLKATFLPANATFSKLVWSSSDEKVATVDSNGNVAAVGLGSCVITVTNEASGLTAQCSVTVVPKKMESLVLTETGITMEVQTKYVLGASFEPADASFQELHWFSSDEKVAKVKDGEIEAVGTGDCVISVVNKENALTAKCNVKVYVVEMESLSLNETKREMAFGECREFELKATYTPSKVTFPTLYWSSSDESVAKVSDGKVEVIGVGSCIISVTNEEKTLTAQCEVMVYMQEITAINCLEEKTLRGENFVLSATYEPSFVSPGCDKLYWESSDESIATVNKETGEIVCMSVGECIITVGNTYNDITATCRLTVLPSLVSNLSLNKTSLTVTVGHSEKLLCTVTPNSANKEVEWESSDNSVVTVAEDGTIIAIGKGKAIIKVTALDGSGCSAECVVKVIDEEYVKDYIKNKISIAQTGFSGIEIGGVAQPGSSWSFKATNNGDETIYLKEVRGYGSISGTISINMQLAPGGSYSGSFNTNSIDWVFEIAGIECVKRY